MHILAPSRVFNIDKEKDFATWYNTIIYAADLVDNRYNVKGFVVHRPHGVRALRAIYELFERALEESGHEPVLFPSVIASEAFERESEHIEGFAPQVFWVTKAGVETLERPLALRPTSETAFYQMYAKWIRDASDLPLRMYQSCNMWRAEHETLPFIRGREFLWIEAHNAFTDEAAARKQVAEDITLSKRILGEQLALPLICFKRPEWDKFPGAVDTYAYDVPMPDGRLLQVATTHYLGEKFAKAFGITYRIDGEWRYVHQTCFGPGIWRILAACISVHGDSKGLCLPFAIAPTQVAIIPILTSGVGDERIVAYAKSVESEVKLIGLRVALDLRRKTPGWKFNQWELMGAAIRIEVGSREVAENAITLVDRATRLRVTRPFNEVRSAILQAIERHQKELVARASGALKIQNAISVEEVAKALSLKAVARSPWCSTSSGGAPCAASLAARVQGAKVRGTLADAQERATGNCIVCGKQAGAIVYIAKQY